ncbi:bifunctional 3-(3-hydroxy-phenyl)propionate/3-hydroxycinnamic acid hydroxylase [Streptomyces sp. NBC_00582]|uniref:bifunctional 3-(3-hydroxy-phenyl)propionate/3-hydroxycinnamic acid hydroxylase n=1 Tax=Streptomyces sp. NBC_00582 TaxID=2975783 RepID=UPI002E822C8E|nr:bifunctional 3-(3-hydroxy-phenyl)propionate/3-hydroxycinnamic acid hydroxylase [Streptomyces sp. NBC_00582]WUB66036.1 bifunctional 3-(3-hydroxy-phenyl)propionate/3-hydroxycinnamic acid hydroxylase [Streptomyces sp. NBC_00582]
MDKIFDVAIAGYGPTGMVAASLLGQLGHEVVVCERWTSLYGMPRATHMDDNTLRAVQAAADVDEAFRDVSPTQYQWVNGKGEQLMLSPAPLVGPMGFYTQNSIYQPDVEDAIDHRVRTLSNVEVRQGWAVSGLSQDSESVELTLTPWRAADRDAAEHRVRARYVIAADGSKSDVRRILGVERDDFGFNERWLNVDVEWLRPAPAEFASAKQFCDPARGHMYINIGEKRQRFEFALLEGEATEEFERPETAWRLLKEKHGLGPEDVRFIRQIVYTFEAREAQRWRDGRVLLTGDAAHTMPPYAGQGACSGIRDAVNLSWKLDLVLRGLAEHSLLDAYEQERKPHTNTITQMSLFMGSIANMHDPVAAAKRDEMMMKNEPPVIEPGPTVTEGILHHEPDGTVKRPVGDLVPQGRVTVGDLTGRFDDVVGRGFVLVSDADVTKALTPEQRGFLERLGCRVVRPGRDFVDEDGVHTAYLRKLDAVAYLARPDFVLFGSAADEKDLSALVDELRTALAWSPGESTVETQSPDPAVEALHRAMPYTRLVDCGMNPADARTLLDATAGGRSWIAVAEELAGRRARTAEAALAAGHRATALQSYRWAVGAALFAQMAEESDTPLKKDLYRRYTQLVGKVAELSEPVIERIDVPYHDGQLVGWLCLPPSGTATATVVLWGGLSGWGANYLSAADALTARGLACLLAEGPGQGEARLEHELFIDEDAVDGFARFLDVVAADPRLGDAIGVQGNSFGGLFAAHLAARDPRVKACVVNCTPTGAPPAKAPAQPSAQAGPPPAFAQMTAAIGAQDGARVGTVLGALRFDPAVHRIEVPLLALHGGADPFIPDPAALAPFAEAAGDRGELRTWPDGEHTLYNHAAERDALTADWFAQHLAPATGA